MRASTPSGRSDSGPSLIKNVAVRPNASLPVALTPLDFAIAGSIALMAVWGFWQGLTVRTLALAGFGAGAVLGASVSPLLLDGGVHSTFAPILAFPGALLFGGLVAAAVERVGLRQRQLLTRLGLPSAIGGALLAGCLGLAAAWVLGAAMVQLDSLKGPVERSAILERLNAVLPRPGPVHGAAAQPLDPFPTFEGAAPAVGRPDPFVVQDPDIRAAGGSVVRIEIRACGGRGVGSGWIAANGIVATNAHVLAGKDPTITVQVRGTGPEQVATPIWFDRVNDIALLRTPGVRGIAPLPLLREPERGASAAMLGFPGGRRRLSFRPARLGRVTDRLRGRMGGPSPGPGFPRSLYGRTVTVFAARGEPGNSGGPLVDTRGRVVTTVFGGGGRGLRGLGVPNPLVRSALRRAGPAVDTGSC